MEGRAGVIDSIDVDRRGDTLAVAVAAVDTVLVVTDTADFNEGIEDDGGWLIIGDDTTALRYTGTDEDTNTVTLESATGATYEAGLPVVLWDPTVKPHGARVVEYEATVITDIGPVPAIIPHEKIPLSGVENLVGASVSLVEDDDGDWFVGRVFGREARLAAQGVIRTNTTGQRVELVDATTAHGSLAAVELYSGYEASPGVESEPAVLEARFLDSAGVTETLTLAGPPGEHPVGPNLTLETDLTTGVQFADLHAAGEISIFAAESGGKVFVNAAHGMDLTGQLTTTGSVTLQDLATDGASVDAGARFCRVGDNGRLFASDNPPASLQAILDDFEARIAALESP